jgi:hypothetical protein
MTTPKVISLEFLLWCQLLLLWSIAAYGITADPLKGETARVSTRRWSLYLGGRALLVVVLAYIWSRSVILSGLLFLATLAQPLLRSRLRMRWLAECEGFWMFASMLSGLSLIRYFHLSTHWVLTSLSPAQQAALCILASTLLIVVRGGTYVVRGVLRKSGTLPKERMPSIPKRPVNLPIPAPPEAAVPATIEIAAAVEQPASTTTTVDVEEYNRGRLIGNLERIVLTIVIAAGSYAALAFLVAAKGVVRSDEFHKDRDFTEYFLIGSLASVLVALCAGMALRFALIRLWPDLLTLQIQ